jgi:hypothetical protein
LVNLTGLGVAAPSTTSTTPSGGYSIAVEGVAGTLTQTAFISLVVQ